MDLDQAKLAQSRTVIVTADKIIDNLKAKDMGVAASRFKQALEYLMDPEQMRREAMRQAEALAALMPDFEVDGISIQDFVREALATSLLQALYEENCGYFMKGIELYGGYDDDMKMAFQEIEQSFKSAYDSLAAQQLAEQSLLDKTIDTAFNTTLIALENLGSIAELLNISGDAIFIGTNIEALISDIKILHSGELNNETAGETASLVGNLAKMYEMVYNKQTGIPYLSNLVGAVIDYKSGYDASNAMKQMNENFNALFNRGMSDKVFDLAFNMIMVKGITDTVSGLAAGTTTLLGYDKAGTVANLALEVIQAASPFTGEAKQLLANAPGQRENLLDTATVSGQEASAYLRAMSEIELEHTFMPGRAVSFTATGLGLRN
jgi:hypothetical protein